MKNERLMNWILLKSSKQTQFKFYLTLIINIERIISFIKSNHRIYFYLIKFFQDLTLLNECKIIAINMMKTKKI